jgi:hypothetical protein
MKSVDTSVTNIVRSKYTAPLTSDIETNFTCLFIYFAGAGRGAPRHVPTVPNG